ncbi:MAG: hypothetical protein CO099_00700 [Bdellovibrio sp. CG_4_9_14_3_um_filter_39_7]|nr:MAG: hypothetical protein CO099_00700 [Bdellovibrio sp. CG_4_9_14_3_um_filter_39_7]
MRNYVTSIMLTLLFLNVSYAEENLPLYFWDNQEGLISAQDCKITTTSQSPFRVSSYTGSNKQLTENIRNYAGVRQSNLPTGSLVKLVETKYDKDDFQSIQVVGNNEGNPTPVHRWFSQRGDKGYLYNQSLLPAEDFVFELGLGAPEINQDEVFKDLINTKWALISESQYYKLTCDRLDQKRDYVVFKVYRVHDLYRPAALVGVSAEETEIFKSISSIPKTEMADKIPAFKREALLVHLIGNESELIQASDEVEVKEKIEDEEIKEETALEVAKNTFDEKVANPLKAIVGGLKKVVCISGESLNVRNSELDRVLFKTQLGEPVKVFQSFNAENKVKLINGERYEFVKVQFPEREETDQKEGWIAELFIKAESDCKYIESKNEVTISKLDIKDLNDPNCCEFPTVKKPTHAYTSGARAFGAGRSGGARKHAACDLYRFVEEPIKSVAPGTVVRDRYYFYQGTYALEVVHSGGFLVRYGELDNKSVSGMSKGRKVKMSERIGYMGKVNSNCCRPMLHFELFKGTARGALTTGGSGFQRRSDLLNPTQYLLKWESEKF